MKRRRKYKELMKWRNWFGKFAGGCKHDNWLKKHVLSLDVVDSIEYGTGWSCYLEIRLKNGNYIREYDTFFSDAVKKASFGLYLECTQNIIHDRK